MKLLLVGGYPKGYDIPFHPKTFSGKRLRKLVEKHNLDVEYLDLFDDYIAEKNGLVNQSAYRKLMECCYEMKIIALGRWVQQCLLKLKIECSYLPHPASRKTIDILLLENGLKKYGALHYA